jgi:Mrp family chromosome partitioning ATPase
MSTLDQAFIRAYQGHKPRKAQRVDEPARRPVATSAASASSATMSAPVTASRVASVPSASRDRRHAVDAAHREAFGPHYRDGVAADYGADEAIVVAARDLASRLAQLNSSAATSTAEVGASSADDPAAIAAVEPTNIKHDVGLQPAFETRRFQWPRNVEVLIAAAGGEFATFAEQLEERCREGCRTLLVTGTERGEGRTTLVLALARLAANRGLRTVAVDVDLQAPQLAEQLGVRPETGWDDAQAERLSVADALIESLDDRLSLLPLRGGFANPRALAGGGFLRDAVACLRENFDLILLDVGPLGDDAAAIDLAAALGGCSLDDALVVRDRRRISSKQLHETCRRTAALGVRHWDVVENFTEIQGY